MRAASLPCSPLSVRGKNCSQELSGQPGWNIRPSEHFLTASQACPQRRKSFLPSPTHSPSKMPHTSCGDPGHHYLNQIITHLVLKRSSHRRPHSNPSALHWLSCLRAHKSEYAVVLFLSFPCCHNSQDAIRNFGLSCNALEI